MNTPSQLFMTFHRDKLHNLEEKSKKFVEKSSSMPRRDSVMSIDNNKNGGLSLDDFEFCEEISDK